MGSSGSARPDQLLLDFGPPPVPTLANYIQGNNAECVTTLASIAESLAAGSVPAHRFIYVWGPAASGKSHLAGALSDSAAARDARLLVVDDCDRLDRDAQITLFHDFNARMSKPDHALIAFGAAPPGRLALIPELASRLAWGIVFALKALPDEALRAALDATARARGVALPDDLIDWLLTHTRRDLASLKPILARLDQLSLKRHRRITLALLREVLQTGSDRMER